MVNNVLAEPFARLSTSDSRQTALEALIQELTPYEWRFVQSLTSTRTFQFDIIGRLPVELVSQVFSYLDTSTPWQLQHVGPSHPESPRVLFTPMCCWYWRGSFEGLWRIFEFVYTDLHHRCVESGMRNYEVWLC
jgi:hypothetical protein